MKILLLVTVGINFSIISCDKKPEVATISKRTILVRTIRDCIACSRPADYLACKSCHTFACQICLENQRAKHLRCRLGNIK